MLTDIVYRVGGDGFGSALFAERSVAEFVAKIREALYSSTTWGEFRTKLPMTNRERLVDEMLIDPHFSLEDHPFSADDIPGHVDGAYPRWLQQSQLDWFPRDLMDKYGGELTLTTLNGWVLDLPPHKAEEIAEDLRALGHRVEPIDLDIT